MIKSMLAAFAFCLMAITVTNAQPANPDKDWNVGLQLWTFRMFSFHDAIAKADSCGIKYVQAYPNQPLGGKWKGNFGPSMDATEMKEVKAYVKSKGITINAMGVAGAKDEEGWKQLFEFAKSFNIPIIVSEPKNDQWDYINKLAGKYKIRVAIHDHPRPSYYWHPDSVVVAMKGRPNIGACADIGHWARSGLNIVESLKKLEGRIWNIHFKDVATFDKLDADDVNPGKGVIDMPAVFQELKRQGFKGSFSIEHESNWYNNAGDVIEIVAFYNQQVAKLKEASTKN